MTILRDRMKMDGSLGVFEREVGSKIWRPAGTFDNIVLDSFYNALFNVMAAGASPKNLAIGALALGYGVSPAFARADGGVLGTSNPLKNEWITAAASLTTQITNGTVGVTTLACTGASACAPALPSGTHLQLGTGQTVTTNGATAAGATSITVNAFTASATYPVGTAINVTDWTAQRMAPTLTTPTTTDPPQMVWSFYLAAAANVIAITFTEAALLFNGPSLAAGGSVVDFATHVAFAYSKPTNTDVRLDYTLARSLT